MNVSVIIPAWNAESCLGLCLDSVMAQTLPPFEILVIDDGSTDDTARIASQYVPRIACFKQENAGQGSARNTGLAASKGDCIAFLDADDFWRPEFLETCIHFLKAHLECMAVNTGLITRMHNGREVVQPESLHRAGSATAPFVIDDFYAFWAEHDHVRTGSAVLRKSVIDRAGGQRADLRVSQDLEYWGYIATFGKWGYIPDPLWVGNSRTAAGQTGWLFKYRDRRKLCPTVEAWQKRIVPRLTDSQWPYFKIVRGRVAAGYAQNHILGGNPDQARHIVRHYGHEMPDNRLTRLLRLGHRCGAPGWRAACLVVAAREYAKAALLGLLLPERKQK